MNSPTVAARSVKFVLSLVFLAAVLFTACSGSKSGKFRTLDAIKSSGKITIGVFSDKAPFGYVDANGKYQGYDIYFAERLAKELGVSVEYLSVEPASRVEFLETGKVDIILANFTVTKERAEKVDFALPYMKVSLGVVSPDSALITDVEQLKGKSLIVAKGTTADSYFTTNHPEVNLLKFDQYTETFNALLDKRGDAFSTDNTEVLAWALQNPGYTVGIPSLGGLDTIAPAVTKGNTTLLNWINNTIRALANEQFFHKNYAETLAPVYGNAVDPDELVIEGGVFDGASSGPVVYFNYPEWVYYDLIYLADDLGYFENANVKPNYVGQVAAGQMIPALATGALDVVNRHTPLVISAVEAGADIKIFASGSMSTQANPHMKYFVKADSPIKGIADFEGKTLGINSFGACSEFVTKKALKDRGLNASTITMITAPDSEQEVPLLRGNTDVAIIHPLSSGRASANTRDFRLLMSDWDIDGGISGMCPYSVNGDFLKKNPQAVSELTAILSRAAKWNNANREEARALMAKRFGFALEEAEMFEFYEDQLVPVENMQYWYEVFKDEGLLSSRSAIENYYVNDYNPAKGL